MKYKLIQIQTKEEHLCDKVVIDGMDYYVSDEIEDISGKIAYINNDVYKNQLRVVTTAFGNQNLKDCKKVIATNNPNIDIPKMVYKLSADNIIDNHLNLTENGFDVYSNRDSVKEAMIIYANQETHHYSEEDVIDFATFRNGGDVIEEFKIWKEQKTKTLYYE